MPGKVYRSHKMHHIDSFKWKKKVGLNKVVIIPWRLVLVLWQSGTVETAVCVRKLNSVSLVLKSLNKTSATFLCFLYCENRVWCGMWSQSQMLLLLQIPLSLSPQLLIFPGTSLPCEIILGHCSLHFVLL